MADKKRIVVLSGSGISAESGLSTFRGGNGLWDNVPVEEVCSAQAWRHHPEKVQEFFNVRRAQLRDVEPNDAHKILAQMEEDFDVDVVTQNVDNLHERAGSSNVLHLHGELMKVRSLRHEERVYELPCNLLSDKGLETSTHTVDAYGDGVRPHIVFFGEDVPNFEPACRLAAQAHVFVVIGTTLSVYPAAALLRYAPASAQVYYIDPNPASVPSHVHVIAKKATEGVKELIQMLTK